MNGILLSLTMSLLEALESNIMARRYKGTVGKSGKKMPRVPSPKKKKPESLYTLFIGYKI